MTHDSAVDALLAPPWRVVVIGGTSVGKTTLVNAWAGTDHPTGLAGRTQLARVVVCGDHHIADTPSLDEHPDLFALVDGCDVLVWVLDALRPVSRTERLAIGDLAPLAGRVEGVVARTDLLSADDLSAVLERCARACPGPVVAADLRHAAPPVPSVDPVQTRHRALRPALERALVPVLLAATLPDTWRALCQDTVSALLYAEVSRFWDALDAQAKTLSWPAPPPPPVVSQTQLTPLQRALGGRTAADRSRRADAARLYQDGAVRLYDWLDGAVGIERASKRRTSLNDLYARLPVLPCGRST